MPEPRPSDARPPDGRPSDGRPSDGRPSDGRRGAVRRRLVRRAAPVVRRLERAAGERPALALTAGVGLAVAVVAATLAAAVYDAVSESDGVAGFDLPVLQWAVDHRTPALDRAVTDFTDVGGTRVMPLLAALAAVGLALWWRRRTPVVLMAVAAAGSVLMTVAGKAVIGRTRPPTDLAVPPFETSASFPSGHSLNAVVVSGTVAYLVVLRLERRVARAGVVAVATVFAAAMGLSRVFLGHHWLTDVLVAWALGVGWLALVVTGHQVWLARHVPPDLMRD